jgi:putative hemolysin
MVTQTELFIDLSLIALFFVGSWFFSGFESGMISMNRYRLVRMVRNGDKKAKALAKVLRDSHRFLATTLVGNNICNVALSTLSATLALSVAAKIGLTGPVAQTISTLIVALLLLMIGEYLPKLWFTARPFERCQPLLPVFNILQKLLAPLATLCIILTRLVAGKGEEKRSPFVSRENIAFLMRDSEAHGQVSAFERMMVSRVLDLQLKRADQLMTPIRKIARIYENDSREKVLETFRKTRSRVLPIFKKDTAQCVGILHLSDLLRSNDNAALLSIARIAYAVDKCEAADNLLTKMRSANTKLLLVCHTTVLNEIPAQLVAHNQHQAGLAKPEPFRPAYRDPVGIITQEDVLKAVLDDELLRSSTDRHTTHFDPEESEGEAGEK